MSADLKFTGSFRLLGTSSFNPDNEILYPNDDDAFSALIARGIISGSLTSRISVSINVVQDLSHFSRPPLSGAFTTPGSVSSAFRHPDLQWNYLEREEATDQNSGTVALDHASVTFNAGPMDLTVGRQPINLATCFFLKPNDFCQPFAPQAFNTIYKPGVDAVNAAYFIGIMSEISLAAVAGYDGDTLDTDESALLVRGATTLAGFRVEALGGSVRSRYVIGGAFQGEIGTVGIRGEGHYAVPDEDIYPDQDGYLQAAVGFDRKWPNSLHVFLEYLYRENGVDDPSDYARAFLAGETGGGSFSAKHYAVAAARYELHPLVNWEGNVMMNLNDGSLIGSSFIRYSVADEADFVCGVMIPAGESPGIRETGGVETPVIESEYGTYPASVYAEVRFFF